MNNTISNLQVFEVEGSDGVLGIVRVVSVLANQVQLVVVVHAVPIRPPVLVTLHKKGVL